MDQIQLTPEELFFLGRLMDAKYIDYDYYAAMGDIQKQFDVREREALSGLEEKGAIEESFSGEIEISEEAAALMRPVFFGTCETRLDADRRYNFHIGPEGITMGVKGDGFFSFLPVTESDLRKLLRGTCTVSGADVERGAVEKAFSEEELKQESTLREAVLILKGDWKHG